MGVTVVRSMEKASRIAGKPACISAVAARGFGETLQAISRAAARLDAPFLRDGVPIEEVRALWSQAFDALIRITALERAVSDAKIDAERDGDFSALFRLKSERDAERRAVRDGTAFASAGSTPDANIH